MSIVSADSAGEPRSRRPLAAFVGIGPRLVRYDVDVARATLVERDAITLAENIQYAWPHASGDYLYVAASNGGPGGTGNNHHQLCAIRIDPHTGAISAHGSPTELSSRPVHLSTDIPSEHVLLAYSHPSAVSVHRIEKDGTIGERVVQPDLGDIGIYPHQIRVDPANTAVLLVTRGHDAAAGKAEEPGALKVFGYRDGVLTPQATVAPGGGYGFGPRHLDMHPRLPWVFVSLERQNSLAVFGMDGSGRLSPTPVFEVQTLADLATVRPRQMTGAIHVHPNGRFLYIANRALGLTDFRGTKVSVGGETSIAVYAIDAANGEVTKIQSIDSQGGHPRTFAIDPGGRLLIAANSTPLVTRDGDSIVTVPANLAVFSIGDDGMLAFHRRFELPTGGRDALWTGISA